MIVAICLGMDWLTVPDTQADEPQTIAQNLRDEFACPSRHAEWLDDKTVQCLKVLPRLQHPSIPIRHQFGGFFLELCLSRATARPIAVDIV